MKKTVIRILGIAPNEKIQATMYEVAESHSNISMVAYVGNMFQGVEVVRQHQDDSFDIILARGETAAMIRMETSIPVLEIQHTFYDVLHAIKLAETFHEPYAVLGFASVTSSAHRLRDLMQLDFDIYTLCSAEEAPAMASELKQRGYHLIVSGMSVDYIIRRYGLRTVLISSSSDSIEATINQAADLCGAYIQMRSSCAFYQELLNYGDEDLIVYDSRQTLIFSSIKQLDKETALSLAAKDMQDFDLTDNNSIKTIQNLVIHMKRRIFKRETETYIIFSMNVQKHFMPAGKNNILYYGRTEANDNFLQHYNELFPAGHESDYSMDQLMVSPLPVMLVGEAGTGREQIAAYLYVNGALSSHTYVIVDFRSMNEKTWSLLINHVNSPLNYNNTTIYFRSLEFLSSTQLEYFLTIMDDTNLCSRNRIFFSYATDHSGTLSITVQHFIQKLSCLTVHLTPLRDRQEAIPSLASMYISTLNLTLLKQVTGFTPEAMDLLRRYPWPNNLPQFKRVLTQLVSAAYSPYIQKEHVQKVLAIEDKNLNYTAHTRQLGEFKGTLAEIEREIVKIILAENGGNQSQTAKRLGICRTTLWKMLK